MTANQAMLPIHAMCHAFGVSRSGYYAWAKRRPPSGSNGRRQGLTCPPPKQHPRSTFPLQYRTKTDAAQFDPPPEAVPVKAMELARTDVISVV